jgi:hypothetical protein
MHVFSRLSKNFTKYHIAQAAVLGGAPFGDASRGTPPKAFRPVENDGANLFVMVVNACYFSI